MIRTSSVKLILKFIKVSTVIVACLFLGYALYLVLVNHNILSCKSVEFMVQATFNLIVVLIFLWSACSITKMIQTQIDLVKDDAQYLEINKSRKIAMSHIWLLLIWLLVVASESLIYSAFLLAFTDASCQLPYNINQSWKDLLKIFDWFINYQSWFIPLIWLYWPTKARKQENRSRKLASD